MNVVIVDNVYVKKYTFKGLKKISSLSRNVVLLACLKPAYVNSR